MNIVIVGGGTAGWLAALFLSKMHPQHSYTLVESDDIGVIGTGEGSTGALHGVLTNTFHRLGCNIFDFIRDTKATPKLGIKFSGWVNHDFYSPIDGSLLNEHRPDPIILNAIVHNIPPHLTTFNGARMHFNLLPFRDLKSLAIADGGVAWHFDGKLVGKYFKSICNSVTSITAKVDSITRDNSGNVTTLHLDNNQTLTCDLVIDCSGFNSIFKQDSDSTTDYSKYLPVNCAVPFLLPNNDLSSTPSYTEAIALKHGWVWKIPVGNRFGCGYVFNNDTTSYESAMQEVEEKFGAVEPIKTIKFKSSMLTEPWKNNVIRIGLSGGFLEPLQATAIHTAIAQLYLLSLELVRNDLESTSNVSTRKSFNSYSKYLRENFVDLINIHYKTGRTDSEFWKYMSSNESTTDKNKEILEICQYRIPTARDLPNIDFNAGINLLGPVIAGLGLVSKDVAQKELDFVLTKNPYDLRTTIYSMHQGVRENTPFTMNDYVNSYLKN